MSSNIETIENVLLASAQPLTGEQLSALTSVKKNSITSAINRLSQRRADLFRASHAGRSYYAIGQEKFQGKLALNVADVEADAAPKPRAGRDRNGKFVKRSHQSDDSSQFKLFDTGAAPEAVEVLEDRSESRRRMARMDEPSASENSSDIVVDQEADVSAQQPTAIALDQHGECSVVVEADSSSQSLRRHRQDLLEAMDSLKKEQQAAVKRVVRSESGAPNKVRTVTNPDLFRGWFNPTTGVRAERLGLDA